MGYTLTSKLNDAERCTIVCEVLSGKLSRAMALKKYNIGGVTLYRWIRKFASPTMMDMNMKEKSKQSLKEPEKSKRLTPEEEIARLRKELRSRTMEADLYKEALALAGEKYGIDILKKFGAK